jgi:hypothetical protein
MSTIFERKIFEVEQDLGYINGSKLGIEEKFEFVRSVVKREFRDNGELPEFETLVEFLERNETNYISKFI